MASLQQQNGTLKAQSARDCEAIERAAILQTEVEELRGRLELLTEHCHALTSKPTLCAKCMQGGGDQHEGPTWPLPYPAPPLNQGGNGEALTSQGPLASGDAEGKHRPGSKRVGAKRSRRVPIWARSSGFGGARATRRSVQYQWAFGRRVRRVSGAGTGDSMAPAPARAPPMLRASSPLWRNDQIGRQQKPVPRPVPHVTHPPQASRQVPHPPQESRQAPPVTHPPQASAAAQNPLAQLPEQGVTSPVMSAAPSAMGVEALIERIPLAVQQKLEVTTWHRNGGPGQGESMGAAAAAHTERREDWASHGQHPLGEGGHDAGSTEAFTGDPQYRAHVPGPRRSRSSLIGTGVLVRPALRPTVAVTSIESVIKEQETLGAQPAGQVERPLEGLMGTAAAAGLALQSSGSGGDSGVHRAQGGLPGVTIIGKPAAPRMTVAARVVGADNGAGQQRRETVRVLGSHADVLASLEMLGL